MRRTGLWKEDQRKSEGSWMSRSFLLKGRWLNERGYENERPGRRRVPGRGGKKKKTVNLGNKIMCTSTVFIFYFLSLAGREDVAVGCWERGWVEDRDEPGDMCVVCVCVCVSCFVFREDATTLQKRTFAPRKPFFPVLPIPPRVQVLRVVHLEVHDTDEHGDAQERDGR